MEFKLGSQNAAADPLSGDDEEKIKLQTCAISRPNIELFAEFKHEAACLSKSITKREENEHGDAGVSWLLVDPFVLHHGLIFIPSSSALWPQILAVVKVLLGP